MSDVQVERKTVLSDCRQYRYTLWRDWDMDLLTGCADDAKDLDSYAMFIGLNPSTADETKDDPTIRKCIGFAKRWGFAGLMMTNLFAFRATEPRIMKRQQNPVGENNIHFLISCSSQAGIVIAAWGVNGTHRNQDLYVMGELAKIGVAVHRLRKTKAGHPEHPLYVPYEIVPKIHKIP